MPDPDDPSDLQAATTSAWGRYLDLVAQFRPELHRYCRRLTGDIWDAEDLVQDTLVRGFSSLALAPSRINNPRGFLVTIATRCWVDSRRRQAAEARAMQTLADLAEPNAIAADRSEVRDASARLLRALRPQERAALVLKEVFDLSLAEIATTLSTSIGAVKSALHRGRAAVKDLAPVHRSAPSRELVDRFVERLDAADLAGLLDLMLDGASIEMRGHLLEVGRGEFERKGSWLWQAVNVHPDLPPDMRPPKWTNERVEFRGEPIVLGFAPAASGRTLQGITRFEEEDGKIAAVRSYCFSPETAGEVADALGLTVGWIPYRFPSFALG
ncbi:MAG: sigma-70 family RNA polymerase sigma factor [Caulobacterales bacterium]